MSVVEPVPDHHASPGATRRPARAACSMAGSGLPIGLAPDPGAGLDGGGDGRAVGLAATARERAELVRVGGDQPGPPVVPDGVEGDLELLVGEAPVVAGDHDVDLAGSLEVRMPAASRARSRGGSLIG